MRQWVYQGLVSFGPREELVCGSLYMSWHSSCPGPWISSSGAGHLGWQGSLIPDSVPIGVGSLEALGDGIASQLIIWPRVR